MLTTNIECHYKVDFYPRIVASVLVLLRPFMLTLLLRKLSYYI